MIKFSRTFWDWPKRRALVMAVNLRLLMCGPTWVHTDGVSEDFKNPTYVLVYAYLLTLLSHVMTTFLTQLWLVD